ncbi:MAG: LapA family protein [Gammaproteobacteria bacterium]
MLRKLLLMIVVGIGLALAIAFAAMNEGVIELELGFMATEVQKSLALTGAFGVGWLFGLFCTGLVLLKSVGERRKLRRSLSLAEAEVRNLRSMPIQDAE